MRRFGYPDDEIRAALEERRSIYQSLRTRKPLPRTLSQTERQSVHHAIAWLRSRLAHDPAAAVAGLAALPVLIAQGGKDVQASLKDAELLREALVKAGNLQLTVKTYPELNHPFATSPSGSLADYMDPRAEVSEPFLEDVVAFAKQAFGPAGGTVAEKRGP